MTVSTKVTLAIVSLCLSAAIPTALICSERVKALHREDHQAKQRHLAQAIAYGAGALSPEAMGQAVAAMHLAHKSRIRFQNTPGATSAAIPAGHQRRFVEVTAEITPATDGPLMVALVALLLGLAIFIGRSLATNLSHDVTLVSRQINMLVNVERTAGDEIKPLMPEVPQFSDLRRIADAVNDLLTRILKITVTNFVAIEKTLEVDRVKTQFLANVSHDLRSPLNSILGFSQLLLRNTEDPVNASQSDDLQIISRSGNDLLRLINEVLDSAKVEAGRISLHKEDSLPAELLSQALKEVQQFGLIPEKVRIETELQPGMQAVMVDPQRLTQAMGYIIHFCVGTVQSGKISAGLSMKAAIDPKTQEKLKILKFEVRTSSGAVAETEAQKLFDGFQRRPGRRGLGLELPLAKAFIELHDGVLDLSSRPSGGNTVTAAIPLLQPRVLARIRPAK